MWWKDEQMKYWIFFKGDGVYFGWNVENEWQVNKSTSLESYDEYEVHCTNEEVVKRFIDEARKIGIILKPFDLEKINLLNLVDGSFIKTIENISYEVRNVKLNKLLDYGINLYR